MRRMLLGSGVYGSVSITAKEKLTLEGIGFFEKPKIFDFL
jgi:hypothetical protein